MENTKNNTENQSTLLVTGIIVAFFAIVTIAVLLVA
jgi:hypothetical protein